LAKSFAATSRLRADSLQPVYVQTIEILSVTYLH
jgi:hypothetical protein